jgi:hypothetical protein
MKTFIPIALCATLLSCGKVSGTRQVLASSQTGNTAQIQQNMLEALKGELKAIDHATLAIPTEGETIAYTLESVGRIQGETIIAIDIDPSVDRRSVVSCPFVFKKANVTEVFNILPNGDIQSTRTTTPQDPSYNGLAFFKATCEANLDKLEAEVKVSIVNMSDKLDALKAMIDAQIEELVSVCTAPGSAPKYCKGLEVALSREFQILTPAGERTRVYRIGLSYTDDEGVQKTVQQELALNHLYFANPGLLFQKGDYPVNSLYKDFSELTISSWTRP